MMKKLSVWGSSMSSAGGATQCGLMGGSMCVTLGTLTASQEKPEVSGSEQLVHSITRGKSMKLHEP
jgi:hypothetical protein